MVTQKTLTQNTTYYTAALVFQKILAFVYFTFLARGLGVEDIGRYAFAFSFTTIFSVFVDVGLSPVLTREIAKFKERTQNILSNILGLKIVLSFFVYAFIIILINLLGYPSLTKSLVYLTGLVMLLDTFSTTFWATLRGNQNLKYESLGIMLFQALLVVLGLTLLYVFNLGVVYIVLAMVIASTFNFLFSYSQMYWRLKVRPKIVIDKFTIKALLKISIPFALMGIFARLNTQIDTVFLSKLGCLNDMCESNVGIYSVASKITLAIHFIPLAFVAALFPAMSEYFVNNKEKLARTFEKSMRYLMVIGLPISAGIITLAPDFIPKIFGTEFANSVLPLQILMISLTFIFLTFPIGSFLNATSRQMRNAVNIGIAVVVNIILNLILIPRFIYNGAAIASLASTLVILALGLWVVPQIVKYNKKYLIVNFLKSLFAAVVMAIAIHFLLYKFHFSILSVLGAIIYFVILFLISGFKKDDVRDLMISLHVISSSDDPDLSGESGREDPVE